MIRATFTINLTRGKQAFVDERDWCKLREHTWYAAWNPHTRSFYAVRWAPMAKGKRRRLIRMHRVIMDAPDGMQIDHLNRQTLDNRRHNLRIVTCRGNAENRRNQSPHGPGVRIIQRAITKPFRAAARVDGRFRHIGCFATAEEAREARERFLRERGTL